MDFCLIMLKVKDFKHTHTHSTNDENEITRKKQQNVKKTNHIFKTRKDKTTSFNDDALCDDLSQNE